MDNSVRVQIFDGITNLKHVALNLKFVKSFSPSKQLVQRLRLAELKDDINIFGVFEEVLEAYNVRVVE